MNWKLILALSMFGLGMGLATVSVIPSAVEPAFWIAIFLLCGYAIARKCAARRFAHGVFLGLANSLWITSAHILFLTQYLSNHQREAEMMKSMSSPEFSRFMMALMAPVIGGISGAAIGLLAVAIGRFVKPVTVRP